MLGREVLGRKVRDQVSGFQGVATSWTIFLNGCVRVSIQPPVDKEGKLPDEKWFDAHQLDLIDEPAVAEPKAATGGPTSSTVPQGLKA